MATHSSILTLKIPWTEETGGLQPLGLQSVGHDQVTARAASDTCEILLFKGYLCCFLKEKEECIDTETTFFDGFVFFPNYFYYLEANYFTVL